MAEIIKGDWEVIANSVPMPGKKGKWLTLIRADGETVCQLSGEKQTIEANARLIAAAVNACRKVSHDNPMAAAEGIEEVHRALKVLTDWAAFRSDYAQAGHAGEEPENHPLNKARKALAKVNE